MQKTNKIPVVKPNTVAAAIFDLLGVGIEESYSVIVQYNEKEIWEAWFKNKKHHKCRFPGEAFICLEDREYYLNEWKKNKGSQSYENN